MRSRAQELSRASSCCRRRTPPIPSFFTAVSAPSSCSAVLDRELPDWLAQLDPVIAPALRDAESLSARDYLARIARVRALARSGAPRLDAVDVIASPTLCLTPPLMSDVADADNHLRVNRHILRNTVAVNYLRLCAITMTVGRVRAGLPVGLQLTAPALAEEQLLAIALAAERVLGTAADRLGTPPLLAA